MSACVGTIWVPSTAGAGRTAAGAGSLTLEALAWHDEHDKRDKRDERNERDEREKRNERDEREEREEREESIHLGNKHDVTIKTVQVDGVNTSTMDGHRVVCDLYGSLDGVGDEGEEADARVRFGSTGDIHSPPH